MAAGTLMQQWAAAAMQQRCLNSCPGIALVVGMDRDAQAAALARKNLAAFHDRAVIMQGNFADIKQILGTLHMP